MENLNLTQEEMKELLGGQVNPTDAKPGTTDNNNGGGGCTCTYNNVDSLSNNNTGDCLCDCIKG